MILIPVFSFRLQAKKCTFSYIGASIRPYKLEIVLLAPYCAVILKSNKEVIGHVYLSKTYYLAESIG